VSELAEIFNTVKSCLLRKNHPHILTCARVIASTHLVIKPQSLNFELLGEKVKLKAKTKRGFI
jgi:hypothetical protein